LKRALFLIVVVAVLIFSGFLSYTLSRQGAAAVPGIRVQTDNPEASVVSVTPQKGAIFFAFTAIALGSLIGMGITLALIFWLLNRGVAKVRQAPNESFSFSMNASNPHSVGGILTRRPSVTVAVIVVLLITLSAILAVVLGVFTPR
jgi:hypothetical protein